MRTLLLTLFVLAFTPSLRAEPLSKHPVVERITTEGVAVGDDKPLRLAAPLVAPEMSAEEQEAAILALVGLRRMEQFMDDSIVAPQKLSIDTLRKTADRAAVRSLDLYFVVRGDLAIIHEKDLLRGLMAADKPAEMEESGFETYAESVGPRGEQPEQTPPKGTLASSLFRYRFPILERVVISGLVRGDGLRVNGALIQSAVSPRDRLDDASDPTHWRAIPRGAETDAELGPPERFQGFVCYLQATQLSFLERAVLIECHAAYVEPYGWFNGRNILASKLPLVMQKSVRDFRRKLKEAQEKLAAGQ